MTTSAYTKRYHYDIARGIYRGYVDATPARERVTALMGRGFTASAIGRAAFVSHDTVSRVAAGTEQLWQTTARALQNVTEAQVIAATPGNGYVPRLGATRRVRALQRLGYTMPAIAQAAGVKVRTVHSVVDPSQGSTLIARTTHDAIDTAYRQLCMTPGPDRRTARMGEKRGWVPPLAWDDIDDPIEQPNLDGADRGIKVADIEWLVRYERHTWDTLADRFGVKRDSVKTALRRAGRTDLMARITENTLEVVA